MKTPRRIGEARLVQNILELLRAIPELKKTLPADCEKALFWRTRLHRNAATRRLLLVLRELPAFNEQLPKSGTSAAWRKLLGTDSGSAAATILREIITLSEQKPVQRRPIRRWRDAYGTDETIQRIRPVESDAWLPNPHRGTTTFQRFQGDPLYPAWNWCDTHGPLKFPTGRSGTENRQYIPRTTLSYCRWPWAWLEPIQKKYRWDIVDAALRTAHERGQTLQLRFQPYTERVYYDKTPCPAKRHPPKCSVNVPDWYWDTGARWIRKGMFFSNEPDCNDAHYLKYFGNFIRAFARRYDGHPDLESVDIAYAGFWGEAGGNTTPATAARLANIYLRSFKQTQLLSMLGTPGCQHAQQRTAGTRRPIGWRTDCFGDLHQTDVPAVPYGMTWNHTYDVYPKEIERCGLRDAWQSAPVTMETCWNIPGWFIQGYDLDAILREGYRYHTSVFMPKSGFFPAVWREKLEEFDKKIGYRFVLRQALLPLAIRRSERFSVECFIDNVGCAPIYRPYQLALRFRQPARSAVVRLNQDIRGWLPGHRWFAEQITLPQGLKPGEAKVDLAILGSDNRPRVWFAIDGDQVDGWHALTSVDIL